MWRGKQKRGAREKSVRFWARALESGLETERLREINSEITGKSMRGSDLVE